MNEQQTVAPEVSRDISGENAGGAPVFGSDDGTGGSIPAAAILGHDPQTTVADGGDDAAGDPDSGYSRPPSDDSPGRENAPAGQAAIDRAFGQRLNRERRKWEREHGQALDFARRMARLYPGSGYADILRQVSPPEAPEPENAQAAPGEGRLKELARRIAREGGAVREQFPEFDEREFITGDPQGLEKLEAGYSLRDAYVLTRLNDLLEESRKQGESMAAQRIRARNARIPEATRGSAGSMGKVNVAALTDEEFARIERMVSSGQKVRLT